MNLILDNHLECQADLVFWILMAVEETVKAFIILPWLCSLM